MDGALNTRFSRSGGAACSATNFVQPFNFAQTP